MVRLLPARLLRGPSRYGWLLVACVASAWLPAASAGATGSVPWQLDSALLDNWNNRDGLRQINVQAIAQDEQGQLWLGTQSGINRFDGVHFQAILPEDHPQLPSAETLSLLHADNHLFVGTTNGLAVRTRGRFRAVPLGTDAGLRLAVRALVSCNNQVWAASNRGLYAGDAERMALAHPQQLPFLALACDGDALLAGGDGVVHSQRSGQWQRLPLPESHHQAQVTALSVDASRLWVGTSRGLLVHQGGRWRTVAGPGLPATGGINSLLRLPDGELLVGGRHGLAAIRDEQVRQVFTGSGGLAIGSPVSLLLDRESNLWVGSDSAGLFRLARRTVRVNPIPMAPTGTVTWSLVASGGNPSRKGMWVGTNDGVFLFQDGRFQRLLNADALPHPDAYNLLADGDRLWIGTRAGLVYVERPEPGRATPVRTDPRLAAIGRSQVHALLRSRSGALWIGTTNGLWELRGDALRQWQDPQTLHPDLRVTYLEETGDGALLVGTSDGAFRIVDGRIQAVALPGPPNNILVDAIRQLPGGDVMYGLRSGQLLLQHGSTILPIAQPRVLAESSPFHMAVFADYLWVVGIGGVARFRLDDLRAFAADPRHPPAGEAVMSSPANRLSLDQGNCCNGVGTSKGLLLDGVLHMPGRGGVFAIHMPDLGLGDAAPIASIQRIQATGLVVEDPDGQPIRLPRGARDVTIDFSLASLRNPGATMVRFRLVGFDQGWREADPGQRRVQYTNLPPGDYRFEVTGTTSTGVEAPAPASLEFSIPRFFSETLWSKALLLGIVALLAVLAQRMTVRIHRRREALLDRLVQDRTSELHQANSELERLSTTDSLTGLHNRRHLSELLPNDMAHYARHFSATREWKESVVFCVLDLDEFKQVNDTRGHHAGDRLLQSFGKVLKANLRNGDHLARWGGEEFVLVLRPMPSEQVPALLTRLVDNIRAACHTIDTNITVPATCSIGAAEFPQFNASWQTLLALADFAMYQVKQNGRDNWALLRPRGAGGERIQGPPGDLEREIAEGRILLLTGPRRAGP